MLQFLKNFLGKTPTPSDVKEQVKEESILPIDQKDTTSVEPTDASIVEEHPTSGKTDNQSGRQTLLSLHESWEEGLSAQEKYSLSFVATELPPIESGNISLAGLNLTPHEEGIVVTAFVRNGSDSPVTLGKMNLVVLIHKDELFSRQLFDLSELGEIPPYSARPWQFIFLQENFLQKGVMLLNWKLAFELAQKKMVLPQQLELEESWIKALTDEQKDKLIQLAQELPPLQAGEVNVQSVQIRRGEDGSLSAMLLIRNGSEQSLSIERLPLALYDAAGDKVAEGVFELNDFIVNAQTSKPWMFIYPAESILKEEPDFTRWKVNIPQS